MVTRSRMLSIFFTGSLLDRRFRKAEMDLDRVNQRNRCAVGRQSGSHRIKKTSGEEHGPGRASNVRRRDESVALPDTPAGIRQSDRLITSLVSYRHADRLFEVSGESG